MRQCVMDYEGIGKWVQDERISISTATESFFGARNLRIKQFHFIEVFETRTKRGSCLNLIQTIRGPVLSGKSHE